MNRITNKSVQKASPKSSHRQNKCRIEAVGKRRDGRMRYWCIEHKADATAKYGVRAKACLDSGVTPIPVSQTLDLHIDEFAGGIALWGAVPAVYDTTLLPMDRGIHVHAHTTANSSKHIDHTYRALRISGEKLPQGGIYISELEAIYFMVASVFGFDTKLVTCSHCGYPHLDKDFFSVHPHRRHLCAGCGRHFHDKESAIGNPISGIRNACGIVARPPRSAGRKLKIRQKDFPGGIQIWGSNPALIWTSEAQEEAGIHVHAFKTDSEHPTIDDTFSVVTIDGETLDPSNVRSLMAQMSMPSLRGRVVALTCGKCHRPQLDRGTKSFIPYASHNCKDCGNQIRVAGRFRKVVANPLLDIITRLQKYAVRPPQTQALNLRPETL